MVIPIPGGKNEVPIVKPSSGPNPRCAGLVKPVTNLGQGPAAAGEQRAFGERRWPGNNTLRRGFFPAAHTPPLDIQCRRSLPHAVFPRCDVKQN